MAEHGGESQIGLWSVVGHPLGLLFWPITDQATRAAGDKLGTIQGFPLCHRFRNEAARRIYGGQFQKNGEGEIHLTLSSLTIHKPGFATHLSSFHAIKTCALVTHDTRFVPLRNSRTGSLSGSFSESKPSRHRASFIPQLSTNLFHADFYAGHSSKFTLRTHPKSPK